MPRVQTLVGEVRRELVAAGSKSERSTLVLVTDGRRLRLRRRGAAAFGDDPELAELAGRRVAVTGTALATTFLVDSWISAE